jgi:hypothetical protein
MARRAAARKRQTKVSVAGPVIAIWTPRDLEKLAREGARQGTQPCSWRCARIPVRPSFPSPSKIAERQRHHCSGAKIGWLRSPPAIARSGHCGRCCDTDREEVGGPVVFRAMRPLAVTLILILLASSTDAEGNRRRSHREPGRRGNPDRQHRHAGAAWAVRERAEIGEAGADKLKLFTIDRPVVADLPHGPPK